MLGSPVNVARYARAAATLTAAALMGLMAAVSDGAVTQAGLLSSFPQVVLVAVLLCIATIPIAMRDWRVALWMFMIWLPVEDLARKFANNDLRVYYVKDFLFLSLLVIALPRIGVADLIRRVPPRAIRPLACLAAWSLALAAYMVLTDWRLALIGLRLNFLYSPLLLVGLHLARPEQRMRNFMLVTTSILAVVASVGILQAIIGPTFLAPGADIAGLQNLYLERASGSETATVFQPSGTFIDPGRFAQAAGLTLACGAALASLVRGSRWRTLAWLVTALGLIATWAAGKRTVLLVILGVAAMALVAMARNRTGRVLPRLLGAAVVVAIAMSAFAILSPDGSESRFGYLAATLDPRSENSEWSGRISASIDNIFLGIRQGGIAGTGVGTQSLGRQYLYGSDTTAIEGTAQIESGYGSVAAEIGLVGLLLWLWWIFSWSRALTHRARTSANPLTNQIFAAWIGFTLIIGFLAHYSYYQNYYTNAFLWLISGLVLGASPRIDIAPRLRSSWHRGMLSATDDRNRRGQSTSPSGAHSRLGTHTAWANPRE